MTHTLSVTLVIVINEVENCLDKIKKTGDIEGAINWGDLHVVRAEFVISTSANFIKDTPNIYTRVYIEEAAPVNPDLVNAIVELLPDHFKDIEILTEW